MKINHTEQYKNGQFIKTTFVTEFTEYELEVIKKLYDNNGLSTYEDEYFAKYNGVIFHLIKVGLIHRDYELPAKGTFYILSDCIKDILEDHKCLSK